MGGQDFVESICEYCGTSLTQFTCSAYIATSVAMFHRHLRCVFTQLAEHQCEAGAALTTIPMVLLGLTSTSQVHQFLPFITELSTCMITLWCALYRVRQGRWSTWMDDCHLVDIYIYGLPLCGHYIWKYIQSNKQISFLF